MCDSKVAIRMVLHSFVKYDAQLDRQTLGTDGDLLYTAKFYLAFKICC